MIMVSALDDQSPGAHGAGAGAEDFLSKPVSRRDLCELVQTLLLGARRADEA